MTSVDDMDFSADPKGEATPDDLVAMIEFNIMTELRVCVPATVVTWTPAVPGQLPATVDVNWDFMYARAVDNAAEIQPGELPSIETGSIKAVGVRPTFRRVPVVACGVPGMNIRGPISVGTTGLYIVADRCIDQWKNRGGPLDPATDDKHDMNDGFFLPTAYHGLNTPVSPTDSHQIGPDDGTAGIDITTTDGSISMFTAGPTATVEAITQVLLGINATLAAARQTDKTSADASMNTFITGVFTAITQIATLLNTPGPVIGAPGSVTPVALPNDFGVITGGSAKVVIE